MELLQFLRHKTLSKRGYSWSGKVLSSLLLTLTHTYPLENKFVNPEEWNSDGQYAVWSTPKAEFLTEFYSNHHRHWGKLYKPEEVVVCFVFIVPLQKLIPQKLSWHVPNDEEIGFAIRIFKEIVEPTLSVLESLVAPGTQR